MLYMQVWSEPRLVSGIATTTKPQILDLCRIWLCIFNRVIKYLPIINICVNSVRLNLRDQYVCTTLLSPLQFSLLPPPLMNWKVLFFSLVVIAIYSADARYCCPLTAKDKKSELLGSTPTKNKVACQCVGLDQRYLWMLNGLLFSFLDIDKARSTVNTA